MKFLIQLLALLAVLFLAVRWLVVNLASQSGGWLDVGYYVLVGGVAVVALLALARKIL